MANKLTTEEGNRPVYDKVYRKYWRKIEWMAFRSLFNSKQTEDDFKYEYNAIMRLFYRLKAAICFLFRRYGSHYTDVRISFCNVHDGWYEYSCIKGGNWTSIDVGQGVFKNWYIHIYDDTAY